MLSQAITKSKTPYDKAIIALLGISYIQPFEDGNKRTARMMANALLLAHGCAPLSYRSVEEAEYREAGLVFYELNSMMPMKDIFIGQYEFATQNYAVTSKDV
jgi:fido (protein-threonine AMPylation protein)